MAEADRIFGPPSFPIRFFHSVSGAGALNLANRPCSCFPRATRRGRGGGGGGGGGCGERERDRQSRGKAIGALLQGAKGTLAEKETPAIQATPGARAKQAMQAGVNQRRLWARLLGTGNGRHAAVPLRIRVRTHHVRTHSSTLREPTDLSRVAARGNTYCRCLRAEARCNARRRSSRAT